MRKMICVAAALCVFAAAVPLALLIALSRAIEADEERADFDDCA